MADNSKDKNKNKGGEDSNKAQPMNKRTPGKKGRNWRGDSADFSEGEGNNTKFKKSQKPKYAKPL